MQQANSQSQTPTQNPHFSTNSLFNRRAAYPYLTPNQHPRQDFRHPESRVTPPKISALKSLIKSEGRSDFRAERVSAPTKNLAQNLFPAAEKQGSDDARQPIVARDKQMDAIMMPPPVKRPKMTAGSSRFAENSDSQANEAGENIRDGGNQRAGVGGSALCVCRQVCFSFPASHCSPACLTCIYCETDKSLLYCCILLEWSDA